MFVDFRKLEREQYGSSAVLEFGKDREVRLGRRLDHHVKFSAVSYLDGCKRCSFVINS